MGKGFSSSTINFFVDLINNALEGCSFGITKKNGEAKVYGIFGINGVWKIAYDGGRGSGVGILAKPNGSLAFIDGLATPMTVFNHVGFDAAGFQESSFAENEKVISKEEGGVWLGNFWKYEALTLCSSKKESS